MFDDAVMESRQVLRLSVAIGDDACTRQLLNRSVCIDGVDPTYVAPTPEEAFFRAFHTVDFDICELSLSSFARQTDHGDCKYIGIPAFVSRGFQHTAIYVRTDRIKMPADLIGKRVGIQDYRLTANVWVRALLADDYGVHPNDLIWVRGGIEDAARIEKATFELPPDIRMEQVPADRSLSALLEDGEIDALVTPRAPSCFSRGAANVGRLFGDPAAAIKESFGRTGVLPIMRVLGVRRELAEQYPFLPVAIYRAFDQARAIALVGLTDVVALRASLPLGKPNAKAVADLVGQDSWPYGLTAENRDVLDIFLSHHYSQGLSTRRLQAEELFHPSPHEMVGP